ncbi:MAG: ATP-binding protein [Planctomycetota bacterium]
MSDSRFPDLELAPAPVEAATQGSADAESGAIDRRDLGEVIDAYNQLTDRLQRSYDRLSCEVVRLQRELASTNAQLHRAKRLSALGEMAAGIAHEVRNPLAAIQLYATMVADDLSAADSPSLDASAAHCRHIVDAVRGLDGIVNDVLAFSREIEPRLAAVDLHDLAAQAIERHRPELDRVAVSVELTQDLASAGAVADADAHLLGQALLNLIRNAADAMADRPVRRLAIGVRVLDDVAQITVADTGPGIAEDAVDRIFNPFFTTRDTGTGLGLAIVHRILDAHAGGIAVHNDPATGGAVFTLTFPAMAVRSSPAKARRVVDDSGARAA